MGIDNIIIPISITIGLIASITFISNMYSGALVLGVIKVFDSEIKKGTLSADNEVVLSERKKLKKIKESLLISTMILAIVCLCNIIIKMYR